MNDDSRHSRTLSQFVVQICNHVYTASRMPLFFYMLVRCACAPLDLYDCTCDEGLKLVQVPLPAFQEVEALPQVRHDILR